nr:hypothetical protein B11C_110168 [Bartonella sp. 1-1C]
MSIEHEGDALKNIALFMIER